MNQDQRHQAEWRRMKASLKNQFYDHLTRLKENQLGVATNASSEVFYKSKEWLDFRYEMLKIRGNRCEACGAGPKDGASIQVDHVRPRYLHPELAFTVSNIQILCKACNQAKGIKDQTRWDTFTPQLGWPHKDQPWRKKAKTYDGQANEGQRRILE